MASESEVLNLLGLMANPKTAQEAQDKIAAYSAKVAENEKVLAQVNEIRDEAAKFRAEGMEALRKAEDTLKAAKAERAASQQIKDQADIRAAETDQRQEVVAAKAVTLDEKLRDVSLQSRQLDEREVVLRNEERYTANLKAELDRKLKALKAIVND